MRILTLIACVGAGVHCGSVQEAQEVEVPADGAGGGFVNEATGSGGAVNPSDNNSAGGYAMNPSDNDSIGGFRDTWPTSACPGTAQWDLTVKGVELNHNGVAIADGTAVWVSVVEPTFESGNRTVIALLTTEVSNLEFTIECVDILPQGMNYPEFAVFFDLDHDGFCSTSDLGQSEMYYAWDEYQPISVAAPSIVGSEAHFGEPFCSYFGFPTQ